METLAHSITCRPARKRHAVVVDDLRAYVAEQRVSVMYYKTRLDEQVNVGIGDLLDIYQFADGKKQKRVAAFVQAVIVDSDRDGGFYRFKQITPIIETGEDE